MDNKIVFDDDSAAVGYVDTPQELMQATAEKVEKMLNKHFPEHIKFDNNSWTISRGSTQVMIIIRPFTYNETCVECMANVVNGANITPELLRFLLRKNAELHFGSFGLLFDDTITFSHSIAGMNLDDSEFINSLNSIAVIADFYDDQIVEIAGGKRSIDMLADEL